MTRKAVLGEVEHWIGKHANGKDLLAEFHSPRHAREAGGVTGFGARCAPSPHRNGHDRIL